MTIREELTIAIESGFLAGDLIGVHTIESQDVTHVYTSLSEDPIEVHRSSVMVPGSYSMQIKVGIEIDCRAVVEQRVRAYIEQAPWN